MILKGKVTRYLNSFGSKKLRIICTVTIGNRFLILLPIELLDSVLANAGSLLISIPERVRNKICSTLLKLRNIPKG